MKTLKPIFLFLCTFPMLAFAQIEIQQFDTPQQEADYRALIAELRCPQCQNNNIADSNATIATDMRHKTLELLKQGKTKSEVVDYMVERYGNFVTYDPPLTAATLFLWLSPMLLMLGGIGFVLRRKSTQGAGKKTEKFPHDDARLRQILNKDEK